MREQINIVSPLALREPTTGRTAGEGMRHVPIVRGARGPEITQPVTPNSPNILERGIVQGMAVRLGIDYPYSFNYFRDNERPSFQRGSPERQLGFKDSLEGSRIKERLSRRASLFCGLTGNTISVELLFCLAVGFLLWWASTPEAFQSSVPELLEPYVRAFRDHQQIEQVMGQVTSNVELKETVEQLHRQVDEQLEIRINAANFDPLNVNSGGRGRKEVMLIMLGAFVCLWVIGPSSILERGLQ